MANIQVVNYDLHKNIRVMPALNYSSGVALISPDEVLEAQREYPVLFRKHEETGQLFLTALLGFQQNENLFCSAEGHWSTNFIPSSVKAGPFLIGLDKTNAEPQLALCINTDDSRLNADNGEFLFDSESRPSKYLEGVRESLMKSHQGLAETKKIAEAFLALDLIDPVNIEIEFIDKMVINFSGAYTINVEKLSALDGPALKKLHEEGYLALAFFIAGSLGNVRKLINLKNQLITNA
jgi:hypothetical protein